MCGLHQGSAGAVPIISWPFWDRLFGLVAFSGGQRNRDLRNSNWNNNDGIPSCIDGDSAGEPLAYTHHFVRALLVLVVCARFAPRVGGTGS